MGDECWLSDDSPKPLHCLAHAMVMDPSNWEQQGEEAEVMFLLGALFSPSAIFFDYNIFLYDLVSTSPFYL